MQNFNLLGRKILQLIGNYKYLFNWYVILISTDKILFVKFRHEILTFKCEILTSETLNPEFFTFRPLISELWNLKLLKNKYEIVTPIYNVFNFNSVI